MRLAIDYKPPRDGKRAPAGVLKPVFMKLRKIAKFAILIILVTVFFPASISRRQATEQPKQPFVEPRYSLLVVGDSLSIGLGEQLEQHFARYSGTVSFERLGKTSSGLARPDFFDWQKKMEELVEHIRPNIVVVMIGANDKNTLTVRNRSIAFGTHEWRREYTARLHRLYEICRRGNSEVRLFWVGVPIMRDPALSAGLRTINHIVLSWCRSEPACVFIDTWAKLASENGEYSQYIRDLQSGYSVMARTMDGVHLTAQGSSLVARETLDSISKYYSFE